MYPGLSHGAYECLHAHGTDEQKATYLPKLTSGEWTGTMCLTEPHCGTDLGLLRTKAEPQPDGSYKITGQKIFISRRRARPGREHRPPGAGAPARCAAGHQGHLAVRGAEVPAQGRRLARRAQRRSSAAASSTRWASTATPPRRSILDGAIGCAGGPAQQGPAGDVRDDERGAPGRGQPVAGPDRGGLPERAWPTPRTASRCARCRARRRRTSRPTRSSCTPTCARCC